MSCNQSGFCAFGNSWWWIIILLLIFGTGNNGCGNSCGCDTGCGCCQFYMTQRGAAPAAPLPYLKSSGSLRLTACAAIDYNRRKCKGDFCNGRDADPED